VSGKQLHPGGDVCSHTQEIPFILGPGDALSGMGSSDCLTQMAAGSSPAELQPHVEAVKGGNAMEQENYVQNKGSYSCSKAFSQLGLRAVSQLIFFIIIAGSPFCQTFAEGKGK